MQNKKYSLVDALKFGFKSIVDHISTLIYCLFLSSLIVPVGFIIIMACDLSVYYFCQGPETVAFSSFSQYFTGWYRIFSEMFSLTISNLDKVPFALMFYVNIVMISSLLILSSCLYTAGIARVSLDLYDDKKSSVKRFFSARVFTLNIFLAGLVHLGAFLGIVLLSVIPTLIMMLINPMFGLIMGALGSITLVIIWVIRTSFVNYFIVDKRAGIMDSFAASFNLSKRFAGRIFGWLVVSGLIVWVPTTLINNILVKYILQIILGLVMSISFAYIYRSIEKNKQLRDQ